MRINLIIVRSENRMTKTLYLSLIMLLACLWTVPAICASFPCDPARCESGTPCLSLAESAHLSAVEKIVCDDPTASLLDEKVAGLFWLSKKMSPDHSQVSAAQKKWLEERRDVCKTAHCVVAAYKERYHELFQQIRSRLRPLPQNSSWEFTTPPKKAPDSYCVRFADQKRTRDYFEISLLHDGKAISGKGVAIIDCGLRIQELSWIGGYLEDGIGWLEFDGGFSQLKPSLWRALIAFDGKRLFWRVVHKTEVESHIDLELELAPGKNAPSSVNLRN